MSTTSSPSPENNHGESEPQPVDWGTFINQLECSKPFPFSGETEELPLQDYTDMYEISHPHIIPDNPFVFLLISPSGTGQDVIMDTMRELGMDFARVRTATTRQPRTGEDKDAYIWMNVVHSDCNPTQIMAHLALQYGLVECQPHCGEYYGTPLSSLFEAVEQNPLRPVVIKNECSGAKQITERSFGKLNVVTIAIVPENYQQLFDRIQGRGNVMQRLLDAHSMATEIPYVANYVLCNRERPTTLEGITISAIQIMRLIEDLMKTGVAK